MPVNRLRIVQLLEEADVLTRPQRGDVEGGVCEGGGASLDELAVLLYAGDGVGEECVGG